ncbi:MAG: glycosyltransferase family 9 protein [Bacteroidetes bacterium]|nr:glycosyltransferase family 9 protein [Bacteroidota bacterium]
MTEKNLKILIIRFSAIGDIVLTTPLHHNLRTWFVKKKLACKSFSFKKLNFEKWLLVNFKKDTLPRLHIVDRYFETVANLGVENDHEGIDFFINLVDEVDISKLPAIFSEGYVAFVLGGTFFTKRLPNEKVINLCRKIHKPIIFLGGNAELDNSNLIAKALTHTKVFNAVNKFGIAQSASILKQAEVVITNDTGMMHIAAAFKKRIISIWGNTIPEFGMTPYYGSTELEKKFSTLVQVENLSCRPCSKLGYNSCPKNHFKCMNDIDESKIILALDQQ